MSREASHRVKRKWHFRNGPPQLACRLKYDCTTLLWWLRRALPSAILHPVFFYLLPTALVALLYVVAEGALFAVAAFVCSAFLLYDPVYSFYVSSPHALGELFWFLIIALLGVKCVVELSRHSEKT